MKNVKMIKDERNRPIEIFSEGSDGKKSKTIISYLEKGVTIEKVGSFLFRVGKIQSFKI